MKIVKNRENDVYVVGNDYPQYKTKSRPVPPPPVSGYGLTDEKENVLTDEKENILTDETGDK